MREKHEMPNSRQPLTLDDAIEKQAALETHIAELDQAHASLVQEMETLINSPQFKEFLGRGFWDAHHVDLVWRINGRDVREEADWLKDVWYALLRRSPAPVVHADECELSHGQTMRGDYTPAECTCGRFPALGTTEKTTTGYCCGVAAPDGSNRSCDKPTGHDGDHWTYGGNTLAWK